MATSPLRELAFRTVDSPTALDGLVPRTAADVSGFVDEASANSMGQLRRGFVSGRFNADANMMGAEESRLRAANRNDEADLLRARINIAQGRAGTFAPAEQDVTKLGWQPGRILDYGLGSSGQGAASMVDPVAMGTAANVAGGAVGMAPHPLAKMAGNALRLGGAAAGFGYNALQNKGEFYNDAVRDPETMRNKTAQEIENTGNVHGLAAGALESLFTQSVAGRLTGRPGVKALAKLNTPARIGLDLAGQGATEVAQGMAKRAALGHLNPNRDTSGDLNDSINDFAGGVFGAGPISAGSHLARGGHERTRVVDDLSSNDVSGAKPAAAPAVSAPKNLSESLVRRAQEDKSGGAEAWRNKLLGIPPEGATDIDPHVDAQHEALTQELSARAASGDAVAKKHLDTLSAMSKDGTDWYDEGPRLAAAEHIMGDGSDHEKLMAQYERRAEGRTRVLNAQGMQTAKIGDEDVVVGAPVAPGDMGSGKTGGVKIAPDSPAMKAAVEERRAIKQHGALTAQVMSDAVPEGAKPQLKKIASELGREIAEFGGSGYKSPTPGDTARVQRIAAQMVHLYGGAGANAMVQKISATANAASAPLMKALTASVAAAKNTHAYLSQQRVSRDAAAKQLVAVIPPRAQLTLHRAGLDLTTEEGRKSLLEHAEEFFDGEDTRPTMAFNKTFGAEAVEQMRAIIGQRLEPRIEPLKQSSEDQKTASQASTGKTSDDATDRAEEGAEWERKGADKNIEAAPGTKEYFFKGRSHSTLSLEKKGHPFVADPKTKNLPTLSRLDDVNKPAPGAAAGFNSLQRTEEVAYQAYRADMGESMGATNIRTVSAHEVLNDHNVPAATRAKLMIAYMGKDGTVDANQGYLTRIANLDQRIEAAKEPSKVGPTRSQAWHKNVKARLAAMQEERRTLVAAMAETVGMKEFDGDTTLADVANAYFSSRFLVVAEQMAEKDQLRIQPAELVAMIRRGNDDLDFSDQGKKDGSHLQMQADMNLIRFKSPRAVSKDGEAAVRASDLVRWVFANRNDRAKAKWTSGTAQAHAYRNALMEGIGALAADDHMTGLPWMVNAKGKVESFAKGFPPSLQLNGTTQAKLDHGRKKRAEEAARNPFVGPPDVEAVAREQAVEPNRDRNTDADELVDEGKEAKPFKERPKWPMKPSEELGPVDSARYWDAPAAPATDEVRQAAMADKGKGDKRTRVPKFATAPETVTTRTDENRVPSETEREQRGGVPTERTDLSMRNAVADAALTKIETLTPTNAFRKGSALAEGLWGAFRDGRAGAYARTEALIRALGMPMYRQEGEAGPVGGLHYAAPLAMLLTPEHVARLVATAKNGPVAQEKLDGMRAKVAQALLDAENSEIPLHEKVKLARLLTGNEKVSALGGSLQAALRPIAAQGETMGAKAEPAAAPAKESALMRPWRPEDGEGTELPSRSAGLKGLVHTAVGTAKAGRSLNTQTGALPAVVQAVGSTQQLMAKLGFKVAPAKFADVAAKLLTDPHQDPAKFAKDSAEALSHILMGRESGAAIREALKGDAWFAERARTVSTLIKEGMSGQDARAESFRRLTERVLAGELTARDEAQRSVVGTLMSAVKAFVTAFKKMIGTPEFADVVRDQLNRLVETAHKPAELKEGYRRVTFQDAVNADPAAAKVLAHMASNPNIVLTGSIVLANGGAIYRKAANMLHDLDFVVKGSKEAAEAHLRKAFPGAVQIADFKSSSGSVNSYIVPPAGAEVVGVTRQFGDKGGVVAYSIQRDGKEVGRKWVDAQGEHKTGEAGTTIDFFTNSKGEAVSTIQFKLDGKLHEVKAADPASIFDAKLGMGREKDIDDYVRFTPKVGERMLNTQATPADIQSPEAASPSDDRIAAAKDYVAKVLGPKVKVVFEKTFDAAGEWVKADNVIKLALTNGPGLLTVAHHEAMHAFFDGLVINSPAAAKALRNTLAGADIHERLKALLHNEPAALKQLADPTERVAYAFQFWAAGALDVDRPAVTLFDKFRRAMRTVLGMVRESETALDIMTAFHEGKLADESAAGRVIKGIMARQTWNEDVKRNFDKVVQTLHSVTAPSNDVLRKEVMSATARALGVAMFTNPGEAAAGKFSEGYLNARGRVGKQFSNNLYGALKGLSDRDMVDAIKYLQLSTKPEAIPYAPVAKAVKNVYGLLQRYRTYAVGAGLDLESLGDNYFPRIWDLSQLIENGGKDKFTAMLNQAKYDEKLARILAVVNANRQTKVSKAEVIDAMHRQIIDRGGVDENGMDGEQAHDDLILNPFFGSQNERNFKWLDSEDVEPFLEKDLVGAMSRYLHQGVRAAEFARRFGNGGSKLKAMLVMKDDRIVNDSGQTVPAAAHGQIAAEIAEHLKEKGVPDKEAAVILARHMADIKNSVAAHEGSLGGDISPAFRKLSSAAMAYQNLRLLPLSLFAAFGDVAAIAARGPGLAGAYEAFVKGLTDVYARWKDAVSDMPAARQSTLWDKIAEAAGAVDSHMFLEQMGKAHTSEFMTDFARNSNRRLFMLNGLTAWDRSMRVTATKFAVQFLEDHAGLPDKQHSARWLAELGLNAKDIPLDSNGALIWDRHVLAAEKGIGETEATAQMEKIHYAITRWVEGAVLSPNAAQRPTWGSDPRAAVMFHLKQYTYSMHHTVLKRAFNEASQGNMNPVGALAAGVPIMMASDTIKGLVQGGGSLPAWQHGLDLGDRVTMGAQRAGLAGVGQFGIDALRDPASLLGPTVEQVMKTVLHPTEALGNLHDAVPGLRMLGGLPDMSKALD